MLMLKKNSLIHNNNLKPKTNDYAKSSDQAFTDLIHNIHNNIEFNF